MTPAAPEDNELMYASSDGREYKMVFPEEDAQEIGDYLSVHRKDRWMGAARCYSAERREGLGGWRRSSS
jgi:hypothetical protein